MKNRDNDMPVILAINCNKSSGGGNVMLSLAQVARNNGFRVITVAPEDRHEEPIQNHVVITTHWQKALNWRLSKLTGYDRCIPFAQTVKLLRFIDETEPSLIHIHGLHGYYVDYIKLLYYLEKRKFPIVWTQHDCWAFTGKCPYYSNESCLKWRNECHHCPQLSSYPASLCFDRTRKMYADKKKCFQSLTNCVYVPVSEWLQNEMKHSFLKDTNIKLIANGVDTSIFRPLNSNVREKYGIQNKKIILGVAASWSARKGLEDFFELNRCIDKNNIVIVLIGMGDRLASRCNEAGILPIAKTANREELAQWYSSCDVFFNPSVEETFGLVTVEAMSCGAPIIGYRATATTEVLEGTPNFCIEIHDMEAVMRAINHIFSQSRSLYSVPNRDKVIKQYDLNSQYMKYIDLYKTLLKMDS